MVAQFQAGNRADLVADISAALGGLATASLFALGGSGAGDTLTPAIAMIVVDVVNILFSFGLTYGLGGLPKMGFNGIAAGTVATTKARPSSPAIVAVVAGEWLFGHRLLLC